jgi:hypothetical protein
MQVQGFVYNSKLWEQIGVTITEEFTLDDLIAAIPSFNEAGIQTIANGWGSGWDTWGWYFWQNLYGAKDACFEVYGSNATKKYSESEMGKAYYSLAKVAEAGGFSADATTIDFPSACALMNESKAALQTVSADFIYGDPASGSYYLCETDNDKAGLYNYWLGPKMADSSYDQNVAIRTVNNGYYVSINISDDAKAALLDFFKWFYSDGNDFMIKSAMVQPVAGYVPAVEVSPLIQTLIDLTVNHSSSSQVTLSNYINQAYDGDTIWIQEVYPWITETYEGIICGTIKSADLPGLLAEMDANVEACNAEHAG